MALLLHIQDSLHKILVMSMKVLWSQVVLSVLPYICLDFKIGRNQFLPPYPNCTVQFTSHLKNTQ